MVRAILFLSFSFAVFILDRLVKVYVDTNIAPATILSPFYPYGGVGVFQDLCGGIDFSINHVTNTGAAWGVFSTFSKFLLLLRIALIIGLMVYLFFLNKDKAKHFPLALILTGAIGNVLDHFIYGHVVDMFHFKFWGYSFAVFNVADATIFCGVMLLFLGSTIEKARRKLAK